MSNYHMTYITFSLAFYMYIHVYTMYMYIIYTCVKIKITSLK